MRPAEGEEVYLRELRHMTGEQRLRIGAELYEMGRGFALAAIRAEHPGIGQSDLREKLAERMR